MTGPRLARRTLVLALGGWLGPARAAETPHLRVTVLPYPGYYRPASPGGASTGLDVDIAAELARRSGCELELLPTNPSRLWSDLRSGATDLTAGASYLPERRAEAEFLWLLQGREVVLLRSAQALATPSRAAFDAQPELLLGVTRGGRRGSAAQAWVDALRQQGRVSEGADMLALLRAFQAGRVAAVLLFPSAVNELPELADWSLQDWFTQDRFQAGWAVSKAVPEALRQRLHQAARSLREDGTLQRLLRQHLGEAVARHQEFLPAPP
ncbi:MAG: transporter substrate-binding domain-containing protein [Inhella sp.]